MYYLGFAAWEADPLGKLDLRAAMPKVLRGDQLVDCPGDFAANRPLWASSNEMTGSPLAEQVCVSGRRAHERRPPFPVSGVIGYAGYPSSAAGGNAQLL